MVLTFLGLKSAKIYDLNNYILLTLALLFQFYLSGPANTYAQDVIFNEDGTRIVAARFIIQAYHVVDSNDDKDMMVHLRTVAEESRFNITVYHPLFIYFDQVCVVFLSLTLRRVHTISIY